MSGRFRRAAGAGLALYAVCVFPANIKHAFAALPPGSMQLGWVYHAPRLALQPILVWAALFAGGLVTWPFLAWQGRHASAGTATRPAADR